MVQSRILVEAAVERLEDAVAAERAGAQRIELCGGLGIGGVTPAREMIETVCERSRVSVHVMIRPRGGDFVYSATEIKGMLADVESLRSVVAGIVTGVLDSSGGIDMSRTERLVAAAGGLPVTFHRAFDRVPDQPQALEQLIELGFARVLTSGGAASAIEGADRIRALAELAADRIVILAGGGVRDHNVRDLASRTGVKEVHARLISEAQMKALVDAAVRPE